jgi:phage terminase small subunit
MSKSLTAKQELFCKEYSLTMHATNSAINAGYSKKTATKIGSENISKPDIIARLKELTAPRDNKLIASIDERNEIASSIMRTDADDNISTADRLRAMDILNKASGVYIEKRQVLISGDVNHTLSFNIKPVAVG